MSSSIHVGNTSSMQQLSIDDWVKKLAAISEKDFTIQAHLRLHCAPRNPGRNAEALSFLRAEPLHAESGLQVRSV